MSKKMKKGKEEITQVARLFSKIIILCITVVRSGL
jgi:hypothetical protein